MNKLEAEAMEFFAGHEYEALYRAVANSNFKGDAVEAIHGLMAAFAERQAAACVCGHFADDHADDDLPESERPCLRPCKCRVFTPRLLAAFALEREQRWVRIRSEEDLPKESGDYIVCRKRGDGSPGEVTTRYINVDEEMTRNAARQYYFAWMPIPPYTEAE